MVTPSAYLVLVAPALVPYLQPSPYVSALFVYGGVKLGKVLCVGAPKGWESLSLTLLSLSQRGELFLNEELLLGAEQCQPGDGMTQAK